MSIQIQKIRNIKGIKELKLKSPNIYKSKVGLIYGINGSGKSTIKYIIKSLYDNTKLPKNFSLESEDQEVILKISGIEYIYTDSWNKTPKNKLHIFDYNYVGENIYINGKMSMGNKRALPSIIYGKDNIKMYEEMLKLEKKVEELKIENKDIEKKVSESKLLKFLLELVKEIDFIKSTLLSKQTYIKEVEQRLLKHIKMNLENNENARLWLKEGLSYYTKDCPMCGQSLSDDSIELFKIIDDTSLIKDEYIDIKKELEFSFTNIKRIINDPVFTVKINDKEIVLNQLFEKIEVKQSNFENEVSLFKEKRLLRNAYNKIKINIEAAKDLSKGENRQILKYSSFEGIESYEYNMKLIRKLNKKIEDERNKIDINLKGIIKNDLNKINDDLKSYGFSYELALNEMADSINTNITKTAASLTVGLQLKHNNSSKVINDRQIETTLSYGEKSILSWVLFVTNLKREASKGDNVIILDDPIASHDDSKKFPMINSVRELGINKNNKIIILTHEKSFVSLYNSINKRHIYLLQDSELSKMDVSEFFKNELIANVHSLASQNPIDENNFIEYLVRSRKLIESNALYSNASYKENKDWKNAYNNLSKLLHNESNKLFKKTISTIQFIIRKYHKDYKTDIKVDRNNLDILGIATSNNNNIYSYRIIVENYLRFKLAHRVKIQDELTVGQLFDIVYKTLGDSFKHYKDIKSVLYILNTTYHNDSSTGFGIKDIPEASLKYTNNIIQNMLEHKFFNN